MGKAVDDPERSAEKEEDPGGNGDGGSVLIEVDLEDLGDHHQRTDEADGVHEEIKGDLPFVAFVVSGFLAVFFVVVVAKVVRVGHFEELEV